MKKLLLLSYVFLFCLATTYGQVKVNKTTNPNLVTNKAVIDPAPEKQQVSGQKQVANQKLITDRNVSGLRRYTAYDFSNTRICMDAKDISNNLPAKPAYVPPVLPAKIGSNGEIVQQPGRVQQGLSAEIARMWNPGDVINVGFATNETTPFVIEKVKQFARMWESIANIKFQFVDLSQAKIRVGFAKDGTSWSWVGRDVVTNTFNLKTMNFGWFDNNTSDAEFRRVVLHEFGHALGFIHEHQASTANISWDKEKVYAFFGGEPNNWDRAAVDRNIFSKYSATSLNSSVYDPSSIMHYFFSADLTTNGMSLPGNNNFSATDRVFAREVYPFPPTQTNATGTLRTGDDCDEIDFVVEYNAVNANTIQFILDFGIDRAGKRISWWKQVSIPIVGGTWEHLQMQPDGSRDVRTIGLPIIDNTRGIAFAKAKLFGVHTGLGYTWNVLPALVGGCRVRLTWRNDHCY